MNNQNPNKYQIHQEFEEMFNLRDELEKYIVYWKWFAFSGIVFLSLSYMYLRYTTPKFEVSTKILVKESENSFASELSAFKDLGLMGGGSSNIQNEIEILKSRTLAYSVVEDLALNISYHTLGRVKEVELYKKTVPFVLNIVNRGDFYSKLDTTFYIKFDREGIAELYDVTKVFVKKINFNQSFEIGDTKFRLSENALFQGYIENMEVKVQILPYDSVIGMITSAVAIERTDKSSVLNISLRHATKEKAIDVLNYLILNYNKSTIEDKSLVGNSTSLFINKRLALIKDQLAEVDIDVEQYKKENNLTDIVEESKMFFSSVSLNERAYFENSTQLKLVQFMIDYIDEQDSEFELIPVLGFSDNSINVLTSQYNTILLDRNKVLRNSSVNNPVVMSFDDQLNNYRSNLVESLLNLKLSLDITNRELKKQGIEINSKMNDIPTIEREYKNIERQQKIKEALYLYLLQKQEETEISLAVTTANSKVIDNAYGSDLPISPKRKIVLLAGFLLGLIIPFAVIYIRDMLDYKLHTRKDLEQNVSAPILGDIPINDTGENIVVKEGGRSSTAEAFRLLRTNLDFLLTGVEVNCKSIFITSTTSGEGKSFVSVNLACALALSGKKVALVGMDLRAPKITEYLGLPNTKGITNYIKDDGLNVEDLKFNIKGYDNLDIYSSGIIPPNPAELLLNQRVEDLFTTMKGKYDYIIVDTAPVNLVTDTLLVSKYADLFIYVARAGFLDKRLLAIPQNLYTDNRLPNMAMLINASDYKKSYGYGAYGAYGYGEVEKLPWWKTIFKA